MTSDNEDDKFDINDSLPETLTSGRTSTRILNKLNAGDAAVGIAKAHEETDSQTDEDLLLTLELAALVLTQGHHLKFFCSAKSCLCSRSGLRSGVGTPGCFAGPIHHLSHINPHHIDHQFRMPSPALSNSLDDSLSNMDIAQHGAQDDIHYWEQCSSGCSCIPNSSSLFSNAYSTPFFLSHSVYSSLCSRHQVYIRELMSP
jgi:NAD+ kinase